MVALLLLCAGCGQSKTAQEEYDAASVTYENEVRELDRIQDRMQQVTGAYASSREKLDRLDKVAKDAGGDIGATTNSSREKIQKMYDDAHSPLLKSFEQQRAIVDKAKHRKESLRP